MGPRGVLNFYLSFLANHILWLVKNGRFFDWLLNERSEFSNHQSRLYVGMGLLSDHEFVEWEISE